MDDDDLRAALEKRAGRARMPLAARARGIAVAHPRSDDGVSQGGRILARARSLTLAATSVAVAIVVLAVFALRGPTPDPDVGPFASPYATATGSPPPSPSPTTSQAAPVESWASLTWSAGDDAKFRLAGRNTFVASAVFWRDRWIAVGYDGDLSSRRVTGHIWSSSDGLTWSDDDAWPDVQFDRLVTSNDRLTIVGAHREADVGDAPSMWTSTDGSRWREAPIPLEGSKSRVVLSAGAGGRGWLVRTFDVDGKERWLTGDPVNGTREMTLDAVAFVGSQVRDVVGTPDGWLAFGTSGVDPNGRFGDASNERGAIWSSMDGVHWTAADLEGPGTSVDTVLPVAGGWIATGRDHRGCPSCVGGPRLAWRSDDGRTWSPVDIDLANLNGFGGIVIASDGRRGLLVDTDKDSRLRIRETADGNEWSDVEVLIDRSMGAPAILGVGRVAVGPGGFLTFVDPATQPEADFWMVPRIAVAGTPPPGAATQPPAPTPHDVVCQPPGQPCGP